MSSSRNLRKRGSKREEGKSTGVAAAAEEHQVDRFPIRLHKFVSMMSVDHPELVRFVGDDGGFYADRGHAKIEKFVYKHMKST